MVGGINAYDSRCGSLSSLVSELFCHRRGRVGIRYCNLNQRL